MIIYILLAVVATILGVAYYRKLHPKGYDIEVPPPTTLRTDLLYGYYGCETGQVAAVKGHTNLHWEAQFNGVVRAADDILEMGTFTVLDVSTQLFERFAVSGRNFRMHPLSEAAEALVNLFENLKSRGALQYVKVLVPLDEPNTNCRSDADMLDAMMVLKLTVARYPELAGVKYGVIYAAKPEPFMCIDLFDWVGVDDYDMKSSVLQGVYQRLVAAMRRDAKTILLPGGAFGQDPTPFVRWAHTDGLVAAVVPFCWFGPREPADKWTGIGTGALREVYEAEGATIKLWGEA